MKANRSRHACRILGFFLTTAVLMGSVAVMRAPRPSLASSIFGKIAWMRSTDLLNWDIYLTDVDGAGQQNLSVVGDPANLSSDRDPHFPPTAPPRSTRFMWRTAPSPMRPAMPFTVRKR